MEDKQPDLYKNGDTIANKLDGGKTPLAYIPTEFLWELGDLMAVGAKKYGKDNWRKGAPYSRYYSAALRHMFQWWEGKNTDEDTKANHLIAAIFNLMACYTFQKTGVGEDDRQGTYEKPDSLGLTSSDYDQISKTMVIWNTVYKIGEHGELIYKESRGT